jgi:phenylalanyl-tRNA synthetase beta subunit
MKVSYSWLASYFEKDPPKKEEVQGLLNFHSFEVESVEKIGDDFVYDVKVLPNRAHDCLSHVGIAKELSAITGKKLKEPLFETVQSGKESVIFSRDMIADLLTLSVEDQTLVPRAMKRVVLGVKVGPSPAWLVDHLAAIGQRSINNIVDATNYLTQELGQPVHAFDYDKIAGNTHKEIIIRHAHEGEKVTTLDGKPFSLTSSMLVIADSVKALDIAGIKGGDNSGIDEKTTRIVLSACNFNATNIRKTSQKLGLRTDASFRFEHELSPSLVEVGMERLTALILEVAGGKPTKDLLDIYSRKAGVYSLGADPGRVNKILGTELSVEKMSEMLTRLNLPHTMQTPLSRVIELAPTYLGVPYKLGASILYDAPRLFDCSSFIGYLFSQGGISIPRMVVDQYFFGDPVAESELELGDLIFSRNEGEGTTPSTESREFLPGQQLPQGVTHVGIYMGDGEVIHAAGLWHRGEVVLEKWASSPAFKNIVGFRRIPGAHYERIVVSVPGERLDLRQEIDLIEEIGRIYGYQHIASVAPAGAMGLPELNKRYAHAEQLRGVLASHGFSEITTYSFSEKGIHELENPIIAEKKFLRTDLAPAISDALAKNKLNADLLGLDAVRIFEIAHVFLGDTETTHLALGSTTKENLAALIGYEGKNLYAGTENILEIALNDLPIPLGGFLSYGKHPEYAAAQTYKAFSPYPCIVRDIAVFIPENTPEGDLRAVIEQNMGTLSVRTPRLFDTFTKKFPDGTAKTSYAYRLVFQSPERTLVSTEVDEIMQKIAAEISTQKTWHIR